LLHILRNYVKDHNLDFRVSTLFATWIRKGIQPVEAVVQHKHSVSEAFTGDVWQKPGKWQ